MTVLEGISIAGKSISGCVFFICTGGFGGSDKTAMRAVSFLGAGAVMAAAVARAGEGESADEDGGFAGGRVGK